jgi:hypothetical protein
MKYKLIFFLIITSNPSYAQSVYNGLDKHVFTTSYGRIEVGPMNASYAHIYTDRPKFIFNKPIYSSGNAFSSYDNNLLLQTQGSTKMLIDYRTGNVGIGTGIPSEKFQIGNSFAFHDGGHKVFGFMYSPSVSDHLSNSSHSAEIRFNPVSGNLRFGTSIDTQSNPVTNLNIDKNGNIGIGVYDTKGFKLGVLGKIAAEEVKVAIYNSWPDFVFDTNYVLPTLKEVEKQIKDNGHLKDIPSAKDVALSGFYLGEMDAKLLQKIEELTLYTIQQENKIKDLEEQLYKANDLEKRLEIIENLIIKQKNN